MPVTHDPAEPPVPARVGRLDTGPATCEKVWADAGADADAPRVGLVCTRRERWRLTTLCCRGARVLVLRTVRCTGE